MNHSLCSILNEMPEYRRFEEAVAGRKGPVAVFGLQDAAKAHLIACAGEKRPVLYVCATDTGAMEMWEMTKGFFPEAALFLPRDVPLVHVLNVSDERSIQRVGALTKAVTGERPVILCSVEAVLQKLAPKQAFCGQCYRIRSGDTMEPRQLVEKLCGAGYERVELVESRGQVAARGDLVDIYPPQERYAVRVEFWGDTVDQMREFDPVTQISIRQRTELLVSPAFEVPQGPEAVARAMELTGNDTGFEAQRAMWELGQFSAGAEALLPMLYPETDVLLDYMPDDTVIIVDEPSRVEEAAKTAELTFSETVTTMLDRQEGDPLQWQLLASEREIMQRLSGPSTAVMYAFLRSHPLFTPKEIVQFTTRPAPKYMGDIRELAADTERWRADGNAVILCAGEHAESLADQLRDCGVSLRVTDKVERTDCFSEILVSCEDLLSGFYYPSLRRVVLGATDLFGKKDIGRRKSGKRKSILLSDLSHGNYVVHETYGIGRFIGIEPLTTEGNTRDYLLIEYHGGDRLYVPTENMDRVQKYIGGGDEDAVPNLSRLGGTEWQGRVRRAREAAKKLAVDLAALYAARSQIKGHAFSPDSPWQKQLEERFPYTETPDQIQSMAEIKADMEKPRPMDRLLCGDVGYGKTEIALRAAFKAVQDSKQVALLVPTTILAQQHYNTFKERFSDFPVRIACMSRFKSKNEMSAIRQKLQDGQIDIVIGTHALLSKSVQFKDLGLLIIDEEHRFGVNHKEQIKAVRQQVDVLTLTATPIPRTLNLSMTGIRDISVLGTPPEGRYPVQTVVLEYTDGLVTDAITKEIARGGQVYVVSNKVQNFEGIAAHLRELVPSATIISAHGQMNERVLEKAMISFMEKEADILLCSTIIESGLDIPNANTMIVLDADRFGLAQLYQLRGRIGRSNRLGYAYLTVQSGHVLSEKAQKRLRAIREFTQFGAGFQLAMRDLEIRGAGSLLGAEQHGHIADIGYEYYLKIIRNALQEARGESVEFETDVSVEIPLNAHIPREYVASEGQRMELYRRIADVDSKEQELLLEEEMEDRFGEIPEAVRNLFRIALIKHYAARACLSKVTVSEKETRLLFSEHAALDGEMLISAVSQIKGARIVASEPLGIVLSRRKEPTDRIIEELPQFLYTIGHCVAIS